jgi:uncharacterized lipoprotein YddW (UPF0748 family)
MIFRNACALATSVLEMIVPSQSAADPPANPMELRGTQFAQTQPNPPVHSDAGSLVLWVKPLWPQDDRHSHTFVSFPWSGTDGSYFALSQGWWEPQGERKLYVVLSNQQYVFCFMPWNFDYTLYLPDQWTMLGVTWQSGDPGTVRLFVDGKAVCERHTPFIGGRHSADAIYLGSDRGSTDPRGRPSDVIIKDFRVLPAALSVQEMHRAYVASGGTERQKWMLAIAAQDVPGKADERRVMFDEDTAWSSSSFEMRRRIARIKAAGFNVYAPCVWDGAHAFFATESAPVAGSIRDPAHPNRDPLADLIAFAHREGIEVHPWFVIAGRPAGQHWPEAYTAGAPSGGFNVQSIDFRNFIVALVLDAAKHHEVDGINLDYVRAIGACSSSECADGYRRRFGRSLSEDWALQESGSEVPSVAEWNRAAVTDIVARISKGARDLRPRAAVTVDTVPLDRDRHYQGMDEAGWLQSGLVDSLVDMSYEDPIDIDNIDRAVHAFGAVRQIITIRDYDLFGDTASNRSGDVMADYVRVIRKRWPGAGIGFYHYPHLTAEQIAVLRAGVFHNPAAPAWLR